MRFLIEVDKNWTVTITCQELDDTNWRHIRLLRQIEDSKGRRFPLPPLEDLSEDSDELYCDLCKGDINKLLQVYQSIVNRTAAPDSANRFGRYLFHTLIGNKIWQEICQTASQAEVIELALLWANNELDLHRLNWEMMHDSADFLAKGGSKKVAITRLVHSCTQKNLHQASYPPRVLFVIGTKEWTDPNIRPGAEYLGLLRQFKKNSRSIHSKILQNANPESLKQMLDNFRPDVVHFICHGYFDTHNQHGYLELRPNPDDSEEQKSDRHLLFAEELLHYFQECNLWPIVVLSACYSAGTNYAGKMLATGDTAPLAAELVASGVPIVIGMAGRVSDHACRLFTRRFGEALVGGESIVMATTQGRRAAFALGPPTSVDWAFPTVFMDDHVTSDYIPVNVTQNVPGLKIDEWIRSYEVERDPVFCDRDEFFDAYEKLFASKPVLIIYTDYSKPQMGKTRLLQELAAQALRDGHIPCLIASDNLGWEPGIKNIGQLGIKLLKAIADARKILELQPPLDSSLLKKLLFEKPIERYDRLKTLYENEPDSLFTELLSKYENLEKNVVGVDQVKDALQKDLTQLITDARNKHYTIQQANGRAVVFLDDIHKYDEESVDALFSQKMLSLDGFGTSKEPVPVIMTCSLGTPADSKLKPITEMTRKWLQTMPLKPFQQKNGEDILAYERILLHPFNEKLMPGISNKRWVFNDTAKDNVVESVHDLFHDLLQGIPEEITPTKSTIYAIAKIAVRLKYLIEANDEDLLKEKLSNLKGIRDKSNE
jgi:CHAT domain